MSAPEPNLTITQLPPRRMATMMAAKGVNAEQIGAALGISLSDGPVVSGGAALSLWGTGPGQWLLVAAEWPGGSLAATRAMLKGKATLAEQTGTYRAEAWHWAGAEALLQRGLAIDLSLERFKPGQVLVSQIAHMGVVVVRSSAERFEVLPFRSMAASFDHWVKEQSFGIQVSRAPLVEYRV